MRDLNADYDYGNKSITMSSEAEIYEPASASDGELEFCPTLSAT